MFVLIPIVATLVAILGVTWNTNKYHEAMALKAHHLFYGSKASAYRIPLVAYSTKPPILWTPTPSPSTNSSFSTVAEDMDWEHRADTELQSSSSTVLIVALMCCFLLIPILAYHRKSLKRHLLSSFLYLTTYLLRPLRAIRVYLDKVGRLEEQNHDHVNEIAELKEELKKKGQHESETEKILEDLKQRQKKDENLIANLGHDRQKCQDHLKDTLSKLKVTKDELDTTQSNLSRKMRCLRERNSEKNMAVQRADEFERDVKVLRYNERELHIKIQNLEDFSTEREWTVKEFMDRVGTLETLAAKTQDEVRKELRPGYEQKTHELEQTLEEVNRKLQDTAAALAAANEDIEVRKAKEKDFAVVQAENDRLKGYVRKDQDLEKKLKESELTMHGLRRERTLAYDQVELEQRIVRKAENRVEAVHQWMWDVETRVRSIYFWNNETARLELKKDRPYIDSPLSSPDIKKLIGTTPPETLGTSPSGSKEIKATTATKTPTTPSARKTGSQKKDDGETATASGSRDGAATTATTPPDAGTSSSDSDNCAATAATAPPDAGASSNVGAIPSTQAGDLPPSTSVDPSVPVSSSTPISPGSANLPVPTPAQPAQSGLNGSEILRLLQVNYPSLLSPTPGGSLPPSTSVDPSVSVGSATPLGPGTANLPVSTPAQPAQTGLRVGGMSIGDALRLVSSNDPTLLHSTPGGSLPPSTSVGPSVPVGSPTPLAPASAILPVPTPLHQRSSNSGPYISIPSARNNFNASPAHFANASPYLAPFPEGDATSPAGRVTPFPSPAPFPTGAATAPARPVNASPLPGLFPTGGATSSARPATPSASSAPFPASGATSPNEGCDTNLHERVIRPVRSRRAKLAGKKEESN